MKAYFAAIKDQNTWGADGSNHYKEACGHRHRTPEAAQKCLKKLEYTSPDGNSWNEWQQFGAIYQEDENEPVRLTA